MTLPKRKSRPSVNWTQRPGAPTKWNASRAKMRGFHSDIRVQMFPLWDASVNDLGGSDAGGSIAAGKSTTEPDRTSSRPSPGVIPAAARTRRSKVNTGHFGPIFRVIAFTISGATFAAII